MNIEERYARLITTIREGRLSQTTWGKDADGQRLVCLLSAISPEVSEARTAAACPAGVMPAWLAHLTVSMFDGVAPTDAVPLAMRYAEVLRRWHVLTPERWARLDYEVKSLAVRYAATSTKAELTLAACERAALLCDRASVGNATIDEEWNDATAMAVARAEASERAAAAAVARWAAIADQILSAIERAVETSA